MVMRPDEPRAPLAGPGSGPEQPFPVKLQGPVIRGFGRGSKELGIPTANIPPSGLESLSSTLDSGVYYGFVGISLPTHVTTSSISTSIAPPPSTDTTAPTEPLTLPPPSHSNTLVSPAVLSIGYNPFYANKTRSIEIHILSSFSADFYGAPLNLLMLGFIRPEYDYAGLEALIEDIATDCDVAKASLARDSYKGFEADTWLREFGWASEIDVSALEGQVLNRDGGSGKKE